MKMSDIIKKGFIVYDMATQKYMSSRTSKNFNKSFSHAVIFKTESNARASMDCKHVRENYPDAIVLPIKVILDEKVLFKAQLAGRNTEKV